MPQTLEPKLDTRSMPKRGREKPRRILVVDDEPDLEMLIKQRFRKRIREEELLDDEADVRMLFEQSFRKELRAGQIQFQFALSGEEALKVLETNGEVLLVLSDINMPGMNGLDLLKKVKEKYQHLKVYMITAYGNAEYQRRAVAYGCDDYLTKPLDFGVLKAKLLT